MAFKTLNYNGNLSATITTAMYTVPAEKSAIVTSIRFFNVHPSGTTSPGITLSVQPAVGGGWYPLHKIGFTIPGSSSTVVEDMVTLGAGDKIRVEINATPALDWLVTILERE